MKKKIVIIFFIIFGLLSFDYAKADNLSNSVVKVVTYKNIYWKYIQKLWWGSASIINNKWYIITNSHVVDDWDWNIADYFNICITKDDTKEPDCDYTATIIDRDKDRDVAILKIDPYDLDWNKVDYSRFSYLDIDYNYDISSKDDIYAIWYPSIWAKTITKTKWIVSGTIDYNWYKYIKSDTLISWWNSWWALVNKDNKLIWIPTFAIWYDANIWYSISIKEAKNFIEDNLWKKDLLTQDIDNFLKNKTKIDSINDSSYVDDKIFDFKFSKDYEISDYYEDVKVTISPKDEDKYLVSLFNLEIANTPTIKTQEDLLYFLQDNWVYSSYYEKLVVKKIGWLDFFTPVSIWDPNAWDNSRYSVYFTKLWDDKLIFISVYKPVYSDIEENNLVNQNLDQLFNSINFKTENEKDLDNSFILSSPNISFNNTSWQVNREAYWQLDLYFWNLYDFFTLSVNDYSVYDGKWNSVYDIYKNETQNIESAYKSLINVFWHEWFIHCDNNSYYVENENGFQVQQFSCYMKIYLWVKWTNGKEYYLSWELYSDKNKIEENLDNVIDFLKNNMYIEWDFDTFSFPNIYKNQVSLDFKDLKYQSDNYKDILKVLVKYDLIKNSSSFNWDTPIKWKEYIVYYFRFLYNYKFNRDYTCELGAYSCLFKNNYVDIKWEKVDMYSLFKDMWIPLDEYVDYYKAQDFILNMDLVLSGADFDTFSEDFIVKYNNLSENSVFEETRKSIEDFKNEVYSKENVYIYELVPWYYSSYISFYNLYFVRKDSSILKEKIYDSWKYNYSSIKAEDLPESVNVCVDDWCYLIMTKALMIDDLLNYTDFTLFDDNLKKSKESIQY